MLRESLCSHKAQKKDEQLSLLVFVRTKGLEPPRLSASDPKSDVATNYTMSARIGQRNIPIRYIFSLVDAAKVTTFCNITTPICNFIIIFSYFCILNIVRLPSRAVSRRMSHS